jgi:hypothetical protein
MWYSRPHGIRATAAETVRKIAHQRRSLKNWRVLAERDDTCIRYSRLNFLGRVKFRPKAYVTFRVQGRDRHLVPYLKYY